MHNEEAFLFHRINQQFGIPSHSQSDHAFFWSAHKNVQSLAKSLVEVCDWQTYEPYGSSLTIWQSKMSTLCMLKQSDLARVHVIYWCQPARWEQDFWDDVVHQYKDTGANTVHCILYCHKSLAVFKNMWNQEKSQIWFVCFVSLVFSKTHIIVWFLHFRTNAPPYVNCWLSLVVEITGTAPTNQSA